MFVSVIKIEPLDEVKSIGPLNPERDDAVKTSKILLINKGELVAKG